MSLDSIITINISSATKGVSQANFGIPLIVGYHTKWTDRTRTYTGLAGLVTDGFAVTDPIYLMAQALLSQQPSVPQFKVGRRALPPTQVVEITPTAVNSTNYYATINGIDFYYTSDASASIAEICAGIMAAVNAAAWQALHAYIVGDYVTNDTGKGYRCTAAGTSAAAGGPTGTADAITDATVTWKYIGVVPAVTASGGTTSVVLTADVAGSLFSLKLSDTYNNKLWARLGTNVDPGIATDMTAIKTVDNEWYGWAIDSAAPAEIAAAAAWNETALKIFFPTTADTGCAGSGSADIATTLKTASYARVGLIYHDLPHQYAGVAWMGQDFPFNPGVSTYCYKTLVGVTGMQLTDAEITYLATKRCNFYSYLGGLYVTQQGISPSGEWIDVTRGLDWCKARMQERIYSAMVNNRKIPFTDSGIGLIEIQIRAQLKEAQSSAFGLFALDPEVVVTVPLATAVSSANKILRTLPDLTWSATLAGAIHKVTVTGTVSV